MHRELRELLHTATGDSRFVVALFLDVRGFSSFAKMAESSESAVFLKSVYTRILDEYFDDASFFKLTGDGLLVILDYEESTLTEVVRSAVHRSTQLVDDFPSLTDDDPMVNFNVPKLLGIGLARGAATRLGSGERTLDYSGRPLNLAARLMDLARPSGVVFDASLTIDLLDDDTRGLFSEESVYVRGIADDEALPVYVSASVSIPEFNRHPLGAYRPHVEPREAITFTELQDRGRYNHPLTAVPADPQNIRVHVSHPAVTRNGRKHQSMWTSYSFDAAYRMRAGKGYAVIDYGPICGRFASEGVKSTWPIRIEVEYPVRDDV